MEIGHIIPHIEALIFATDRPIGPVEITELINNAFGFMEDRITQEQVESAIEGIIEKYRSEFYPFELRESGGGWQFLTKKEYHKTVAQLNGEKFLKRLSPAALETLAIIAYKQPITKADIEAIRGVSCDYSIQKLLEKELIVITGRNEELPGKPLVYATSKTFMDYFGINSADELPKLKEVYDEHAVEPTMLSEQDNVQANNESTDDESEEGSFVVTETGELLVEAIVEEENDTEEGAPIESPGDDDESGDEVEGVDEEAADDDYMEEEEEIIEVDGIDEEEIDDEIFDEDDDDEVEDEEDVEDEDEDDGEEEEEDDDDDEKDEEEDDEEENDDDETPNTTEEKDRPDPGS